MIEEKLSKGENVSFQELCDALDDAIRNKQQEAARIRLSRIVEALDDRELLEASVNHAPHPGNRKAPTARHK